MSKEHVQHFVASLVMFLFLPLLPLGLELVFSGEISSSSLSISVAMYALALGTSSENVAYFSICLLIGLIFSVIFGTTVNATATEAAAAAKSGKLITADRSAIFCIIVMIFLLGLERFDMHVVKKVPCFQFMGSIND